MPKLYKTIPLSDLDEGSTITVEAGGMKIALSRVSGIVYATDDICSHAACSLGTDGFLEDKFLTCGCHGAKFDITSGKVLSLPATTDIASYTVTVKKGIIWITL